MSRIGVYRREIDFTAALFRRTEDFPAFFFFSSRCSLFSFSSKNINLLIYTVHSPFKCSSRINVQQVYTSPTWPCKRRRETSDAAPSGVILHILHTLLFNTMLYRPRLSIGCWLIVESSSPTFITTRVSIVDKTIVTRVTEEKKGKTLANICTSRQKISARTHNAASWKKKPSRSSSGTIKFENIESLFSRRFFHTYESVTNYSTRSCGATQLLKKRATLPLGGDRNASINWITHIHTNWNHNKAAQVVDIFSCDFCEKNYLVSWIIESPNFYLFDFWNYYCKNSTM